jgi:hypothetical protein
VIRNVVIHVSNEQPLLADLYVVPSAADVGIVCTNVRTIDGKRPIFIDRSDSTFFFPNLHIRFLEVPAIEMSKHLAEGGNVPGSTGAGSIANDAEQGLAVIVAGMPGDAGNVDIDAADADDDETLDLDEDFLQRIRDI